MKEIADGLPERGSGKWLPPFKHQHNTAAATNAEYPFNSPVLRPTWPQTFNAVHMAHIPVGVHRGKVIVWDAGEVFHFANPFSPDLWSFQRYAIVDPDANATTRFFNYFLPVRPASIVPPSSQDLFCSGHAWSPFGYLVVAGGTEHTPADLGARLVFTFDPRFDNAPFAGGTVPIYGSAHGTRWRDERVSLRADRYYPTVTLTQRFVRPPPFPGAPALIETMLVSGGSDNPQEGQGVQREWFTYEALLLLDSTLADARRVFTDKMGTATQWWGSVDPSTPSDPPYALIDGFHEYPRCHFLTNARVFMAGDIRRSAQVDHSFNAGSTNPLDAALPWAQRWTTTQGGSQYRHACSAVLFARVTAGNDVFTDLVVRIGGAAGAGIAPTNTCEFCFASALELPWFDAPGLTIARQHATAVLLPDASIFLVGGEDLSGPTNAPELFRWGIGWTLQPKHQGSRAYHSTAVLLPDGSVLVAGGNTRTWDYQIYLPPYLTGSPPPIRPTGLSIFDPSSTDPDGTCVLSRPTGAAVPGFHVGRDADDEPLGFKLGKVVLISPGSTTHSSDMHQRYFECLVTPIGPSVLEFTAPSEAQAPRGYYMMFVLSLAGIPSKALWVRLA